MLRDANHQLHDTVFQLETRIAELEEAHQVWQFHAWSLKFVLISRAQVEVETLKDKVRQKDEALQVHCN